GFELGPARKAVLPGNLKLCVGKRCRLACSEEILGLILKMPQIRMLGKVAGRSLRGARHGTFFPCGAGCPQGGVEEVSDGDQTAGGASTLAADRMRPVRRIAWYMRAGRSVKLTTGHPSD